MYYLETKGHLITDPLMVNYIHLFGKFSLAKNKQTGIFGIRN